MKNLRPSILILCCLFLYAAVCGADPLRIEAVDGGVVDLGGVVQVTGEGEGIQVVAEGEGSEVRLDSTVRVLTTDDDISAQLAAGNGGKIILDTEHTSLENGVTLSIDENGTVTTGTLEMEAGSVLLGKGTLDGSLINGGTVKPGDEEGTAGTLTVTGGFVQKSNGTFEVDLSGDQPGSGYDVCTIGGDVLLAGQLNVNSAADFVPSIGTRFHIIAASGSRSGEFANSSGLELAADLLLRLDYTTAGVELVAEANDDEIAVPVIDPVQSPTTQTSQTITGTREAGTSIAVTCSTAVVGTVTYPTDTTWSVVVTELDAGENTVTATATDDAGHSAGASVVIVVTGAVKPGDCDGNGQVSITEVQGAINMYLGLKAVDACVDVDGNGAVSITEVQKAINGYLGL